ncbi:MAG: hypothetical protein CMI00_11070 [Oceanospirillaceae bacterium]|nr:hypothetical protein [Oceanospirillaceae bacterium]|tara:strand:- start:1150 stop:1455 length:306 start_codon:yes stop_codon:yes gene_type:complete
MMIILLNYNLSGLRYLFFRTLRVFVTPACDFPAEPNELAGDFSGRKIRSRGAWTPLVTDLLQIMRFKDTKIAVGKGGLKGVSPFRKEYISAVCPSRTFGIL